MTTGEVQITVADNGAAAILVPAASTQLVLGCSALPAGGAVAYQIVATQNANTVLTNMGPGPLTEAAGLACQAGGTVYAMNVPLTTKGTATAPALTQGTGGSTGSSTITTTLDGTVGAFDDTFVQINVVLGGTIGTGPITLQVSYDAGRNFGQPVALGTANTLALTNLGVTVNFGAGSLVTGNRIRFSTVGPRWAIADMQTALTTFKASPYAVIGVGSIHIVGGGSVSGYTAVSAADIAALCTVVLATGVGTGTLDVLAQNYIFDRAIVSVRDAAAPTTWTGASTAENQTTWVTALGLISSVSTGVHSPRLEVCAGYYNEPTVFPNTMAGRAAYRRPLAWALAQRQVVIPPQRLASRVKDGTLTAILVNPASDPTDGFLYYDTRVRAGKGAGFFCANPNLMSVPGSVFTLYPLGAVMDVACDIVHQVGEDEINSDIRLNANGTIFDTDATSLENELSAALQTQMVGANMISSFTVLVSRTQNVLATGIVKITVSITQLGYILEEDVLITYISPSQG